MIFRLLINKYVVNIIMIVYYTKKKCLINNLTCYYHVLISRNICFSKIVKYFIALFYYKYIIIFFKGWRIT